MYFLIAAISLLIIFIIIYKSHKTQSIGPIRLKQIFERANILFAYYLMGVTESIKDNIFRSWNKTELVSRHGDVAIVTGGARGIGLEVVKKLLKCNMHVIIGCRNVDAGNKALKKIEKPEINIGNVVCYTLDLASIASIKKFAAVVLEKHPQINLLVNNAGIMIAPFELTEDGFESQFATNYLGHCYLTHLLLPRMISSARTSAVNARIVNVTSCVHSMGSIYFDDLSMKGNYMDIMSYGQSKLAQVLFTKSLDARLRTAELPVQVHAVHPGVVYTDIFQGSFLSTVFPWMLYLVFKSPEEGSRSILHACVSPQLNSCGGTYITDCSITATRGDANNKKVENQLWDVMLAMLKIDGYGGIPT